MISHLPGMRVTVRLNAGTHGAWRVLVGYQVCTLARKFDARPQFSTLSHMKYENMDREREDITVNRLVNKLGKGCLRGGGTNAAARCAPLKAPHVPPSRCHAAHLDRGVKNVHGKSFKGKTHEGRKCNHPNWSRKFAYAAPTAVRTPPDVERTGEWQARRNVRMDIQHKQPCPKSARPGPRAPTTALQRHTLLRGRLARVPERQSPLDHRTIRHQPLLWICPPMLIAPAFLWGGCAISNGCASPSPYPCPTNTKAGPAAAS